MHQGGERGGGGGGGTEKNSPKSKGICPMAQVTGGGTGD